MLKKAWRRLRKNVNRSFVMPDGQIIITGASRGIGAAIAKELVGRGYAVVGLSRSGEAVAGRGIACDMTNEISVREVFAKIATDGKIAGLINNAGLHLSSPSHKLTTDEYQQVMELNATSVMVAAREVYPHLKTNGSGTIVNIGSFFDKLGVAENIAYCASKAAVGAITRCLAVEWAGDNIQVLNVAPGYIDTDLNHDFLAKEHVKAWMKKRIPAGQPGSPDQVARLIAAILDEHLSFFTGETIYLDGGQGMNH
jgi:NAD(P)-dependent dehydrogenase (short-subunit alcohol dehydrogenase family)